MCSVHVFQFVWCSSYIWSHLTFSARVVSFFVLSSIEIDHLTWMKWRRLLFKKLNQQKAIFLFQQRKKNKSERKNYNKKNISNDKKKEQFISFHRKVTAANRPRTKSNFLFEVVTIIFELIGRAIFGQFSEFCDVVRCEGVLFGQWKSHNLCAKRKKISGESTTTQIQKPNKLLSSLNFGLFSKFGLIDRDGKREVTFLRYCDRSAQRRNKKEFIILN